MIEQVSTDFLQSEISRLRQQVAEYKRKGMEWYQRAMTAEKRLGELQAALSNKNLSSAQSLALVSTIKLVDTEKPREDGRVYVNYEKVAESIPLSSQSAGSALYTLAKNGIVDVVKEKKKHGPGFNMFLSIPTQTRLNLAHVVVDTEENPRHGGTRIALHKDCGGECIERKKYLCKKCGEDNINAKDVLMVSEESWKREQEGIETEQSYLAKRAASGPETPIPDVLAPARHVRHPRGIACPDCHAREHWRAEPTSYGTEIYVCAVCYPE